MGETPSILLNTLRLDRAEDGESVAIYDAATGRFLTSASPAELGDVLAALGLIAPVSAPAPLLAPELTAEQIQALRPEAEKMAGNSREIDIALDLLALRARLRK